MCRWPSNCRKTFPRKPRMKKDRARSPPVSIASRATGSGRLDGRLGLNAGALFAAAFADMAAARHLGIAPNHWIPFKIGLAASAGAGISMGFAEALSDDGTLTGRGHPGIRGVVCGLMTTLGGIGHTLPYLIANVTRATKSLPLSSSLN